MAKGKGIREKMTSLFVISWQGVGLGLGWQEQGKLGWERSQRHKVPAAAHSTLGFVTLGAV